MCLALWCGLCSFMSVACVLLNLDLGFMVGFGILKWAFRVYAIYSVAPENQTARTTSLNMVRRVMLAVRAVKFSCTCFTRGVMGSTCAIITVSVA